MCGSSEENIWGRAMNLCNQVKPLFLHTRKAKRSDMKKKVSQKSGKEDLFLRHTRYLSFVPRVLARKDKFSNPFLAFCTDNLFGHRSNSLELKCWERTKNDWIL